jgi:hypothetical protein
MMRESVEVDRYDIYKGVWLTSRERRLRRRAGGIVAASLSSLCRRCGLISFLLFRDMFGLLAWSQMGRILTCWREAVHIHRLCLLRNGVPRSLPPCRLLPWCFISLASIHYWNPRRCWKRKDSQLVQRGSVGQLRQWQRPGCRGGFEWSAFLRL